MGAPQPLNATSVRDKLWRDGHQLRSQFLDSFARLETIILGFVVRLDLPLPSNAPFSQRTKALRKERDRFTKPENLEAWLTEISRLTEFRADIVHSILEVVQVNEADDPRWLLMFRNCGDPDRPALLVTAESLRKSVGRLKNIADQFSAQKLKAPAPTGSAKSTE